MTTVSGAPASEAGGTTGLRIVLVAAVADNGVIGNAGAIPWDIPEDMRHFRTVTRGHTVVMGRVTFESIGRPLPARTNVVITRDPDWSAEGVTVAGSLTEALATAAAAANPAAANPAAAGTAATAAAAIDAVTASAADAGEVMVIGGAQVYAAAMALADAQILTEVHQSPEGDTFYPAFDRSEWVETRREEHDGYDFVWLERR